MNNARGRLSSQDVLESVFHASLREQQERGMEERLAIAFEFGPLREFSRNPFRQYFTDLVRILYGEERRTYEECRRRGGNSVTALHFAAHLGLTHLCEVLIQNFRYNVNAPCRRDGPKALHLATRKNRISTVGTLIDLGADINGRGELQITALHIAVMRGYEELVRLLIYKRANKEISCNYGTPLQCAAVASQQGTMQILLNNNVEVDAYTVDCSLTPLHLAVEKNSVECLSMLLRAGADPTTKACGTTPLCHAAFHGTTEMVANLLNGGADPNDADLGESTPLENAIRANKSASAEILLPVTTAFATWELAEVIEYFHSPAYLAVRDFKNEQVFAITRAVGNDVLWNRNYFDAIHWYNTAIAANPNNARVYVCRSLSYARLFQGRKALLDAREGVRLDIFSAQAHSLEAVAWRLLKDYRKALECLAIAERLDPMSIYIQTEIQSIRREM